MAETSGIVAALANPTRASYGDRWERWVAAVFVGTTTGLVAAMAMYVFRFPEFAFPWATGTVMSVFVFVAGVLVKLLVGQMRTSVAAAIISLFVGVFGHFAFELAPFYLLGIPTDGVVLYVPLRDVISVVIFFQAPLQFSGYLAAVVYEGLFER